LAFERLKNYFNLDIRNGVPGKAYVQSSSVPNRGATSYNVQMWLDVYVEGWEPYRVKHECIVKATKHPHGGTTLPVVVDPRNRERIDVQWDKVPTHDELMAAGRPGAPPEGLEGLFEGASVTVHAEPGQTIDLSGTPLADQVRQALEAQGISIDPSGDPAEPGPGSGPDAETAVDRRLAQLERLGRLRDAGLLSPEEFAAQKAAILRGE
jgi:hypothetical protein